MLVGDIFGRRLAPSDPGIVDEDVDVGVAIRDGRHFVRTGHVEQLRFDLITLIGKRSYASVEDIGVAVGDDDTGTCFGESLTDGEANPWPSAGDKCAAAIQPEAFKIHCLSS